MDQRATTAEHAGPTAETGAEADPGTGGARTVVRLLRTSGQVDMAALRAELRLGWGA